MMIEKTQEFEILICEQQFHTTEANKTLCSDALAMHKMTTNLNYKLKTDSILTKMKIAAERAVSFMSRLLPETEEKQV